MPWSSNATFLVEATLDDGVELAVYKPARGERPLWDFPRGLWRREVAAYALSEALGWRLVPLTVARADGPYGEGSLQRFVRADFEEHYFTLREDPAHRQRLQRICVFDLVANNADRKAGHCLWVPGEAIYAIDNGLCFHADPKLRTVIWDFGGEDVPATIVDDVRRVLEAGLPDAVTALLDEDEAQALDARMREVVENAVFPVDVTGTRYPWPLV